MILKKLQYSVYRLTMIILVYSNMVRFTYPSFLNKLLHYKLTNYTKQDDVVYINVYSHITNLRCNIP